MILVPLFPLHKSISFLPQTKLVQVGRLPEEEAIKCTHYHEVQEPRWEQLAEERLRITQAKETFSKCNAKELKKSWNKWDEATLDSYRLQFRVIDLNEDGLIDFNELCHALDEIGDTSSTEERKRYFGEVDMDKSDGVDLQEFLQLIDRVQAESRGRGSIGKVCLASGTAVLDIVRISQLSLAQQIKHGLF